MSGRKCLSLPWQTLHLLPIPSSCPRLLPPNHPPSGGYRSYPDGPVEAGNAFMAAELLAALVPLAKGDAKEIALRKVEAMKEKVLGSEPALLVQLTRAAGGEKLVIKAAKVCLRRYCSFGFGTGGGGGAAAAPMH